MSQLGGSQSAMSRWCTCTSVATRLDLPGPDQEKNSVQVLQIKVVFFGDVDALPAGRINRVATRVSLAKRSNSRVCSRSEIASSIRAPFAQVHCTGHLGTLGSEYHGSAHPLVEIAPEWLEMPSLIGREKKSSVWRTRGAMFFGMYSDRGVGETVPFFVHENLADRPGEGDSEPWEKGLLSAHRLKANT